MGRSRQVAAESWRRRELAHKGLCFPLKLELGLSGSPRAQGVQGRGASETQLWEWKEKETGDQWRGG
jgi:hypothetical protein